MNLYSFPEQATLLALTNAHQVLDSPENSVPHRLEYVRFVVDETPYACWEWDLRKRNLEFLEGIDPDYFRYVAEASAHHLNGEDKHRAAVAVRIAYSQALETLFALLGAAIQAPECVLGWLLAYRSAELESLVGKLNGLEAVFTRMNIPPTWDNISRIIHQHPPSVEDKHDWIASGYARAWRRFAGEFLNSHASSEYNSMKHGFRARPGGFTVSVGIEDSPGQGARPEAMKSLGGSLYGTSFYTLEKLGEGRTNFRARQRSRNWIPSNLLNGLTLLSWSIGNVVSFLRILNGAAVKDCPFHRPPDPEGFNAPWALSPGVTDCSFDTDLGAENITPCSKSEIRDSYEPQPSPG